MPLSSVPGLTAAQIKTLGDSWILTAQELVALYDTNEAIRNRLAGGARHHSARRSMASLAGGQAS